MEDVSPSRLGGEEGRPVEIVYRAWEEGPSPVSRRRSPPRKFVLKKKKGRRTPSTRSNSKMWDRGVIISSRGKGSCCVPCFIKVRKRGEERGIERSFYSWRTRERGGEKKRRRLGAHRQREKEGRGKARSFLLFESSKKGKGRKVRNYKIHKQLDEFWRAKQAGACIVARGGNTTANPRRQKHQRRGKGNGEGTMINSLTQPERRRGTKERVLLMEKSHHHISRRAETPGERKPAHVSLS